MEETIYRQGSFESFYDTPLEINWLLTNMCNYRCSYCFGQEAINADKFSDLNQIKNAVANIEKMNRSSIMITLSGGEPTTHPHLLDCLNLLKEKLNTRLKGILIISNGSAKSEVYEKIASFGNELNIKIEISIHTEFVKVDHIVELIKKISGKVDLEFPLMFNPEKKDLVYDIYNKFVELRADYPFHVIVQTLRQPPLFDELDYRYTEEDYLWQRNAQKCFDDVASQGIDNICRHRWESAFPKTFFWDVYDKNGNRKIVTELDRNEAFQRGLLEFENMYCIQGSSVLCIGVNGACKKTNCSASSEEFNIFEEVNPDELNKASIIKCPYKNCGCGTNHPIPKFKDREEADAFVNIHLNNDLLNFSK